MDPSTTVFQRSQILLCGDSLTQLSFEGWGARLANVYQRRADVINRGYSGYNTTFYLQLLEQDDQYVVLPEPTPHTKVSLAIVFFGANDAAIKGIDDHHYVSLEQYGQNLKTIVEKIDAKTQCGRQNIILIAPPPVHHQQRLDYQKRRYGDKATGVLERTLENTGLYAQKCQQVAKELDVSCLDLYHDMLQCDTDWTTFFHDGLHFAKPGHDFVAERLLALLERDYPDWTVQACPKTGQFCNSSSMGGKRLSVHGPFHDEIDSNNVKESFARHSEARNKGGK